MKKKKTKQNKKKNKKRKKETKKQRKKENIFPAKIYPRVKILKLQFATQKYM